jgi:hypothetical protein
MNRSNLYLLDGIVDEQFWFSEYAVQPIVDDVAEFKVQSHNDQSEFGGVLGGIVNVVSKSGSNQYHGDVWEFLRNDAFDARNPLLAAKTPLKQSVYGATVGGPVLFPHYDGRNRTFFFGAYEGTRINSANELLYNVPTAAEINGDFSAISQTLWNPYSTTPDPDNPGKFLRQQFQNNNISSAIDPVMQTLVKQMYLASIVTSSGLYNGEDTTPTLTNVNNYSLRVDEQIRASNSIWARLSQFHATQTASGGFAGLVSDNVSNGQNWGAGYLHIFGASATLQLSMGHVWQEYRTTTNFNHSVSAGGFDSFFACGFLGPLPCKIPDIAVSGFAGGGDSYLDDDDGDIYQ